jgi:hypothetical protein
MARATDAPRRCTRDGLDGGGGAKRPRQAEHYAKAPAPAAKRPMPAKPPAAKPMKARAARSAQRLLCRIVAHAAACVSRLRRRCRRAPWPRARW